MKNATNVAACYGFGRGMGDNFHALRYQTLFFQIFDQTSMPGYNKVNHVKISFLTVFGIITPY
jgi:hypothetical protein